MIEPSQCRAARALLDWTQGDLANRASISAVSVRAFEKGGEMRDNNRKLIQLTFEASGIQFLWDGQVATGQGVTLKASGAPAAE
jgi:DNA-binding XRE family transcriptional regulator